MTVHHTVVTAPVVCHALELRRLIHFFDMRPRPLYVTFCLTIITLVGCFLFAIYPISTLEELIGFTREPFTFSDRGSKGRLLCTRWKEISIPPSLKDPCFDEEAIGYLTSHFLGPYLCPKSAESYASRYPLFNLAISVKPKIVMMPVILDDVRLAVKLAKQQNLTVTVRNGGHNPAGFSISEGGMVIDMLHFSGVRFVDNEASDECERRWTARFPSNAIVAQGGSLWKDVHPLLKQRHLSAVVGGCPTVGVVGLALGGGIGWTSRHRGLVSDNVLSVRMVLPDGEVTIVDDTNDPELMWALRGAGGSNFGIVTDVILRTYPDYENYLAGHILFYQSPDEAANLLDIYQDTILKTDIDPRLTMDAFIRRTFPHHHTENIKISVEFGLMFDGPIEEGIEVLQPFLNRTALAVSAETACTLLSVRCSSPDEMESAKKQTRDWIRSGGPFLRGYTFTDWSHEYGFDHAEVYWTSGIANEWSHDQSLVLLDRFKYAGIDFVPEGLESSVYIVMEHLGGNIGHGPSLWKHKNATVLLSITSMLIPRKKGKQSGDHVMTMDALKKWTEDTYRSLSPFCNGSYVNYADPDLEDWEEKYYGKEAYSSLVRIKSRLKNSEIFNSAQRVRTEKPENKRLGTRNNTLDRLEKSDFRLARSDLKSDRSDLCPDWLLNTAIPVTPSEIPISQFSDSDLDASLLRISDDGRIDQVQGKNVVLTGGTNGIGFSVALHLLRLGANVIATSQSSHTCHERMAATSQIFSHFDPFQVGTFTCFAVAFDDVKSVKKLVTAISAHFGFQSGKVDILILNAVHNGSAGWSHNMAGVSKAVSVTHLGQFYLTMLLLQNNRLNLQSGRIIIQSSGAAFDAEEKDLIDLAIQRPGDLDSANGQLHTEVDGDGSLFEDAGIRTYSTTKAMNVAFALELARRLRSLEKYERMRVFLTLPPGTALTNLTNDYMSNPVYRQEILELDNSAILSTAEAALSCVYASVASLDILDYPPITHFVAIEDFANLSEDEKLGIGTIERRLRWEYQKQPAVSNYVLGCQVGAIAARFRSIDWMQTNTTCNFWNWSVEILNDATKGALVVRPGSGPLGDLFIEDCQVMF